jgi:hypothetical protein
VVGPLTQVAVDPGSIPIAGIKMVKKRNETNFCYLTFICIIHIMIICLSGKCQVNAILQTFQLQESAKRKGHFTLYNCLVLGHTKNKGVQRIYCNPFPAKPFYGSHRLDLVMLRPPGIDHGAFVVSPSTVWYARVLLFFSASATTDTVSKSRWKHTMILRMVIICIISIKYIVFN